MPKTFARKNQVLSLVGQFILSNFAVNNQFSNIYGRLSRGKLQNLA